jgi:hypothetical protein
MISIGDDQQILVLVPSTGKSAAHRTKKLNETSHGFDNTKFWVPSTRHMIPIFGELSELQPPFTH